MRHSLAGLTALLLCACTTPTPYVASAVAGKGPSEVSKLVAASEAGLFPCSILEVGGTNAPDLGGVHRSEVTLAPGRYQVTLRCASQYHSFKPQAGVLARAGKTYRITGYLVDDSITIFTMKMQAKVQELP